MSKLYHKNGFVNMTYVMTQPEDFIAVIGGRGTGKTFGALRRLIPERTSKFLFLRRTQTQADIISNDDCSPFKPQTDNPFTVQRIRKYISGFYRMDEDGKATGTPAGYIAALSTFASIRGIDFSDVNLIIYDEFIPESHERPIKNEAAALWNVYETVNRNRELFGADPVKLVMLSNSNTINNAIFASLDITNSVAKMQEKGLEIMRFPDRGLVVFDLQHSGISEKKKHTALYRLTAKDKRFAGMALENKFDDVPDQIASYDLTMYVCKYRLDNLYIYKHKTEQRFFITNIRMGTPLEEYENNSTDLTAFRMQHPELVVLYYRRCVEFSSVALALYFKNLLQLN